MEVRVSGSGYKLNIIFAQISTNMIESKDLPYKLSFDAQTDTTELKAPRPR